MEPFPVFKNQETLEDQVEKVETLLGEEIVRESSTSHIYELSATELKEKYPYRYATYLKTLRAIKNKTEITEEEKHDIQNYLAS